MATLKLYPRSLTDTDKIWLSFLVGGILGAFAGYTIAKPGVVRRKLGEFRA